MVNRQHLEANKKNLTAEQSKWEFHKFKVLILAYINNPTAEQSNQVLEKAIEWVSQDCDTAIDIGCGQNWLKRLVTCTVTGVDSGGWGVYGGGGVSVPYDPHLRPQTLLPSKADVIATLGDEWFVSHHAQFDCAFALASIHYRPFDQILDAMNQVMQMCTKRAYITINSRRTLERGYLHFTQTRERTEIERNKKFLDLLGCDTHNLQQPFMDYLIEHTPYTVEANWLFTHDGKDAGYEGDIHMVLSH